MNATKNETIMVTGGAVFLGSHLCDRLVNEAMSVLCVDNLYTGSKANIRHLLSSDHFDFMRHDVTFPQVGRIYNLACPASPIHYQRDPVQTTKTSSDSPIFPKRNPCWVGSRKIH